MKVKRHKHVRKVLTFYKTNFDLHGPYSVLLDGTFCKAALKFKVNIMEQLPKYLDAEVNLMTTTCVLRECESFGALLYGPLKVLKQYKCISCGHDPPQPATMCLRKQAKKKYRKYIIATQDSDLREAIREMTGVPILYISFSALCLEPPSDASKKKAEGSLDKKLSSNPELDKVIALKKRVFGEAPVKTYKKRKKAKEPNPLSCKKKKKKTIPTTQPQNTKTRKRKRHQKKKT